MSLKVDGMRPVALVAALCLCAAAPRAFGAESGAGAVAPDAAKSAAANGGRAHAAQAPDRRQAALRPSAAALAKVLRAPQSRGRLVDQTTAHYPGRSHARLGAARPPDSSVTQRHAGGPVAPSARVAVSRSTIGGPRPQVVGRLGGPAAGRAANRSVIDASQLRRKF